MHDIQVYKDTALFAQRDAKELPANALHKSRHPDPLV